MKLISTKFVGIVDLALASVLALLVAGCGSNDSDIGEVDCDALEECTAQCESGRNACFKECGEFDKVLACRGTGELSCRGTRLCMNTANTNEDWWNCIDNIGTGQPVDELSALYRCERSECAEADTLDKRGQCSTKHCIDERNSCGLSGSGTSCAEMWSCATQETAECADTDEFPRLLFEDYIYNGTAEQQNAFFAVFACMNEKCPNRQPECVQTECGNELEACDIEFGN